MLSRPSSALTVSLGKGAAGSLADEPSRKNVIIPMLDSAILKTFGGNWLLLLFLTKLAVLVTAAGAYWNGCTSRTLCRCWGEFLWACWTCTAALSSCWVQQGPRGELGARPSSGRRELRGRVSQWEKRAVLSNSWIVFLWGGELISCYLPHVPPFNLNWQKCGPILKSVEQLGPKIRLNRYHFCLISQIPKSWVEMWLP